MAEKKECEKSQNIVDEASEKEKKESLNQDRGYNHNYVKRNYVYRLNVTFGDTSFDGNHEKDPNIPIPPRPTTGDLDVQVEVVNWGQVSQDVEI